MMFRKTSLAIVLAFLTLPLTSLAAASTRKTDAPGTKLFDPAVNGFGWREVGPFRGGRAAAVEGVRTQPGTYYFGATGGGVWKTTDSGVTWSSVSDGFFGGSIGAVAVADSDPNVIYVGGGEKTVRGNVSHGDGLWKSLDAGRSWTFSGLADSRHIPRVRIHPRNPDLVYAAVLGHLFGPNQMRGVYRSKDGGKSWERVLFANQDAGAIDLIMDPLNPRTLYASTWRVRRTPYSLESGGEGSALWKSTDGGDSWVSLNGGKGFPKGPIGIIGVTVSQSNPQNVYAIIEANEGGVFRSRDGGATWEKTNESRELRQRAWYYTRIYADPSDADVIYVLNVNFHKSKDGGKTFTSIPTPHGDNHDLWIAPDNPLRMIESNDGGANVSNDGGATWSRQDNQPTAQFYRVSTDSAFPYRLLGGQQDNSAVRIRSRSSGRGIGIRDWEETAGGESGHIVAKPDNPDMVFGGSYGGLLVMANHQTGEFRDLNAWPDNPMGAGAEGLRHRFQWNFPLFFSPNDANTLYSASQYLLRSRNGGTSWETISPDLTRNDKSRMGSSGGPITKDNTSVEYYGTIFAATESKREPGLLWAGSDDGLIHISRDAGKNWKNVTPAAMPEWSMINSIDVHPFVDGGAYVAATRYKSDDFRPYLYRTTDYGKTWTLITSGIAAEHFTRVLRADPARAGLLYAGTERGVYVSFDDGSNWQSLQLKLPVVPITDLQVRNGDLIAATQGRSFWILDDLTPLHQWNREVAGDSAYLFAPKQTARTQAASALKPPSFEGANPLPGLNVDFMLGKNLPSNTKVTMAFLRSDGTVIRELKGELKSEETPAEKRTSSMTTAQIEKPVSEKTAESVKSEGGAAEKNMGGDEKTAEEKKEEEADKLPDLIRGMNRYVWDLRMPPAKKFDGMILWGGGTDGPRVPPGTYQVRLKVGDDTSTVPFTLTPDPRSTTTAADLQAQYDFLLQVNRKLTEVHRQIIAIREVRTQMSDLRKRSNDPAHKPIVAAAKALDEKMTKIEEALYQTKLKSRQDPLNYPIRLNDKLSAVADSASLGDFAPTAQAVQVQRELTAAIDAELLKLEEIWKTDLPALNKLVREQDVPAIRRRE